MVHLVKQCWVAVEENNTVRMMNMVHLVQQCWIAGEGGEYGEDDEDGSPGPIAWGCR